jgi:hypothetical protein
MRWSILFLSVSLRAAAALAGAAYDVVAQFPVGRGPGDLAMSAGYGEIVLPHVSVAADGGIVIWGSDMERVVGLKGDGTRRWTVTPPSSAGSEAHPREALALTGGAALIRWTGSMGTVHVLARYSGDGQLQRGISGSTVEAIQELPDGTVLGVREPESGRRTYVLLGGDLKTLQESSERPRVAGQAHTVGHNSTRVETDKGCSVFPGVLSGRMRLIGNSVWWRSHASVDSGSDSGQLTSWYLPEDEFGSPRDYLAVHGDLLVGYSEPEVGQDGQVYSLRYEAGMIALVRWRLSALPKTESPASLSTPPSIDPVGPLTARVGSKVEFWAEMHGEDVTVRATDAPSGAQTGSYGTTVWFSWVPGQAGAYHVTLVAEDGRCQSATATVSISVVAQ